MGGGVGCLAADGRDGPVSARWITSNHCSSAYRSMNPLHEKSVSYGGPWGLTTKMDGHTSESAPVRTCSRNQKYGRENSSISRGTNGSTLWPSSPDRARFRATDAALADATTTISGLPCSRARASAASTSRVHRGTTLVGIVACCLSPRVVGRTRRVGARLVAPVHNNP